MDATGSGRRGWKKPVLVAVCIAAVIAGFMVWMVTGLRSEVPQTVTASSFEACGQGYEVRPGYLAFDYGSRPHAEVPPGYMIYDVRSVEVGAGPPATPDQIFESWPVEIAELVVGDPYQVWLESLTSSHEASYLGRSTRVGSVSYEPGCRVSVSLAGPAGVELPRPDDWAIVILEARGGDSTIADDLEVWRASELTD